MQYVCLVYHDPEAFDLAYKERMEELDRDSLAYDKQLEQMGHMVLAHALHGERRAKIVRRRQSKKMVTDGPHTETKEQLIGFIVVEAKDMDEAVELAAGIPLAKTGTVVVRETMDFS